MSRIERAIRRACPDLAIDSIEHLGEGDFCRAFLVNKKLVFRFAKHETARASLRRERCLLPQIAGKITLRIPAPRFSLIDEERPENSFIAYEYLPDRALTQTAYLELGDESRTRCAVRVARFLNEIHAVPIELAEACGVSRVDYREKFSGLLAPLRGKLRAELERATFEFAEKAIVEFLESPAAAGCQPALLHGDLSPDHVLFDGRNITSIIDFGDSMIGDAAWDFLWIYEDYGADFFERALAAYENPDKLALRRRIVRSSDLSAIEWLIAERATNRRRFAAAVAEIEARRKKRIS
ncbi:MAG TPA: aminoglycoside phosphotransferase family protein [Pyrinomonadaceae bacterium]|jgi:aminoglycoside 2''-phosphotransferase